MTHTDRFVRLKSKTYREAVQALRKLLREEGLDIAGRASAEATCGAALRDYVRSNKVREWSDWHSCYHRLLGEECLGVKSQTGICDSPTCIPGADHVTEWTQRGKTCVIVSQPYYLDYPTVRQTVEFCDAHGLRTDITASPSWHFPGRVLTVEYRRNRIGSE